MLNEELNKCVWNSPERQILNTDFSNPPWFDIKINRKKNEKNQNTQSKLKFMRWWFPFRKEKETRVKKEKYLFQALFFLLFEAEAWVNIRFFNFTYKWNFCFGVSPLQRRSEMEEVNKMLNSFLFLVHHQFGWKCGEWGLNDQKKKSIINMSQHNGRRFFSPNHIKHPSLHMWALLQSSKWTRRIASESERAKTLQCFNFIYWILR